MMSVFKHELDGKTNSMHVKLTGDFAHSDWSGLIDFYKQEVNKGVVDWELNLQEVGVINSMFIGMIVALNTSAGAHGGRLAVTCRKDSAVSNQIKTAKIDQIVNVRRE